MAGPRLAGRFFFRPPDHQITRDHLIAPLFSAPPRLHASLDSAVTCELPSRKVRGFGCVFGAPFAPAFWREWAEQPNRTRGIGSAAAAGSKDTFSVRLGSHSWPQGLRGRFLISWPFLPNLRLSAQICGEGFVSLRFLRSSAFQRFFTLGDFGNLGNFGNSSSPPTLPLRSSARSPPADTPASY
jgi:hypothetical protein